MEVEEKDIHCDITFVDRHLLMMFQVFAHFDILDFSTGARMAEGHKASFCLEDNHCSGGAEPKYDCENYGDQVSVLHVW